MAILYPDALPDELAVHTLQFMLRLCKFLMCPSCGFHCRQYTATNKPEFVSGQQFWEYTVDFHNAVNERTGKIQVSYEEAETYLNEMLQQHGYDIDTLQDAFLQDWWTVLLLTSMTYYVPPNSPTEEQKQIFTDFIRDFCYITPFGHKTIVDEESKTGEQRLCRDIMVEFLDTPLWDVSDREKSFDSITALHNRVCSGFGVFKKTREEMKAAFGQRFERKNTTDLTRAVQMREEDHKKMGALQKEINDLKNLNGGQALAKQESNTSETYKISTIVLGCALGITLFFILTVFIVMRFQIGGVWKIIRIRHYQPKNKSNKSNKSKQYQHPVPIGES